MIYRVNDSFFYSLKVLYMLFLSVAACAVPPLLSERLALKIMYSKAENRKQYISKRAMNGIVCSDGRHNILAEQQNCRFLFLFSLRPGLRKDASPQSLRGGLHGYFALFYVLFQIKYSIPNRFFRACVDTFAAPDTFGGIRLCRRVAIHFADAGAFTARDTFV